MTKLKSRKIRKYKGEVFDLTIEGTHSYNIEGLSVHNSSAGSLLAWCLDITKIDPIRFGLYFERFLNPSRAGYPDIDTDFMNGTDDVLDEFLYSKYGKDRIASVITFSRFNERGCLKDVVRAHLGQEATSFGSEVEQVTKEMPNFAKVEFKLKDWVRDWPNDPKCSDVVRLWLTNPANQEIIEQALKLQDRLRGYGQHAAGVTILSKKIWNYIPTSLVASEVSKKKTLATAYQESDKSSKDLSALGILKLDRLKLSTMNVIMESIKLIKKHKELDVYDELFYIDVDNKELYEEVRLGMNHGVFQFETPGMNALLRNMQVENFDELVAANALYRPGSLGIGAHNEYIKNKFSDHIEYMHPALEPILGETKGVMIFQEQLMFLVSHVGNISLGDGDSLRRYMDKAEKIVKKEAKGEELSEEDLSDSNYQGFKKYWNMFLDGAEKNGYKKEEIDKLKGWIINYLGYSFNKCLTKNHKVISETRGEINMLDVEIGERILGYNPETQQDEYNPVVKIHHNGIKNVYEATTTNEKTIESTLDHKIQTRYGMETLFDIMKEEFKIKTSDGLVHLKPGMSSPQEKETFDLEIDSKFHNFYANGICVSNSHSLAYSYMGLMTLYLKRYYPLEFYTALLNNVAITGNDEERHLWLNKTIYAAISKGLEITPPSLKSEWDWTITGENQISMGLGFIKGLGKKSYEELQEFTKDKPLCDFTPKEFFKLPFSKFNKTAFESSLKAGVFDSWSQSRPYLLALKEKKKKVKKIDPGQLSIWDLAQFESTSIREADFDETSEQAKNYEFKEVCNFDFNEIKSALVTSERVRQRHPNIESILSFSEDGKYYFIVKERRVSKTKNKDSIYLRLRIGDGISYEYLNMFEPMASKYNNFFEVGSCYVANFVRNDNGFKNFQRNCNIEKI